VPAALAELAAGDGPSLANHLFQDATLDQFRGFVIHRSIYHVREADPHTCAIPRLSGWAKAALIEIQIDEYGGRQSHRVHAELFRNTMRELGLDSSDGAASGRQRRATRFYDEHVEADAAHAQIAAHDLCGAFCADNHGEVPTVLFGATSCLTLDHLFATRTRELAGRP
jgi:hypothetical protein